MSHLTCNDSVATVYNMSNGSSGRRFWGKQDAAAERRALIERVNAGSDEYVYLTDEEHAANLVRLGYIPGAGSTGEGMGEE